MIIIRERSIEMIGKRKPVHPGEVLLEDVIKPLDYDRMEMLIMGLSKALDEF